MNNRIGLAVAGVIAALAIIFAIVQSGNLSQTETKLSAVQSTVTAQQAAFAGQGTAAVATLNAASTLAADTANTMATAQSNALSEAANAAATAQVKALADAQKAASSAEAKALADAAQAASTTQAQVVAAASQAAATAQAQALSEAANAAASAQASAVSAAQNAAATTQAKAVGTVQAQATTTLGAVVNAAQEAQAEAVTDAQNTAATAQGQAVATVQAQASATLGAVMAQAAKTQTAYSAAQMAMSTQIAQANDALATAQASTPANTVNPTAVLPDETAAPTTEAGILPKDWKRYIGKGIAIQLPDTYVGSELGSDPAALGKMLRSLGPDFEAAAALLEQNPDILAFIAVNMGGDDVGPSSVIVVSIPMPAQFSLDMLLDATISQLPRASKVLERGIVQIGDYEAGRMIVQTKVGTILSTQLQYYIIQNNMLYLVGFTGAPGDFDSQVESFEQSMGTFEILAKPGI